MATKRPADLTNEDSEDLSVGLLPTPSPDELSKKSKYLTGYEYPTSTVYDVDGEVVDRLGIDGILHLKLGDRLEIRVLCTIEQLSESPACNLLGYRLKHNKIYRVMYWPSNVVVLECVVCDADIRLTYITTFDREYRYRAPTKLHSPPLIRFTPQMAKVAFEVLNRSESERSRLRIVVVGNKDVGKSTFLRFILNQLLSQCECVQWLDLDPGQCEFTPAGLISLIEQREPLFSPAQHHVIKQSNKQVPGSVGSCEIPSPPSTLISSYYIGHLSPSACSIAYRAATHELCTHIHTQAPLLVNTMGWMSGMGLYFLDEAMQEIGPDFVIHLISNDDEPIYQCSFPIVRIDSCSAQSRQATQASATSTTNNVTPENATASQVSTSAQQRKAKECTT